MQTPYLHTKFDLLRLIKLKTAQSTATISLETLNIDFDHISSRYPQDIIKLIEMSSRNNLHHNQSNQSLPSSSTAPAATHQRFNLNHQPTPPSRLRHLIINKIDALNSTVNIDPKTHKNYSKSNLNHSFDHSFHSHSIHSQPNQNVHQSSTNFLNQNQSIRSSPSNLSSHSHSDSSSQSGSSPSSDWSIIDRLRLWRDDARAQHLYQTAAFWGTKVYQLTSNPNDAFWLAQVYFLIGQFFKAEKILTSPKKIFLDKLDKPFKDNLINLDHLNENCPLKDNSTFLNQIFNDKLNSVINTSDLDYQNQNQSESEQSDLVRMTDYSTACRYLAAQSMIRQGKWNSALEMLGDENPFRFNPTRSNLSLDPSASSIENFTSIKNPLENNSNHSTSSRIGLKKLSKKIYVQLEAGKAAMDGGIKFESSMCYLRGLIHLQNKSLDRAKDCFLESLALDVKCYESFEALVGGNMLEPEQEWQFIQSLAYHHQTPDDALFIKSLYTIRLKKFNYQKEQQEEEEFFKSLKILKNHYNLNEDPDYCFGLADWLFSNYRFQDCFRITSRILKLHYHHSPTLPLHLTCMTMINKLQPSLFLLAHELIERDPNSAISWYAAGLWYFSQKRWEESRRFFSKSALLDSRFPETWFAFGHALAYEGEHDQAITAYSTASHNFQGSHLPMLFIAMQHIQLANPTLANDYLSTAAQICPFDPLVMHERGVVCYLQERWQEAIQFFQSTLDLVEKSQIDPKIWAPTYLNLSHCFRRLQRYSESLESTEKAKALQPRSSLILTAAGMAHHGLGNNLEAINYYHQSLAIVPADPMTTALLKFSLDLETYSTTKSRTFKANELKSPKVDRELVPKLPNQAIQKWDGELERMEEELANEYGNECDAFRLLGEDDEDENDHISRHNQDSFNHQHQQGIRNQNSPMDNDRIIEFQSNQS
ncbi:hypothetical protein O181_010782 [Austropuccinia psidii MF-1]|uniref:Cdc16 n=1 Tax=Austropuccinia psidii MF-1 TaxID=1389203 RepID=A0A9Q3BTB8_9BASI|nr:hypothetical protein [Austropuccinia psidii MF-1]